MNRLDGKVAIVTGAARGLGAAIAALFVAEGAAVLLGDVLDGPGAELAEHLGTQARSVHLDVRDPAEWRSAIAAAEDTFGPVGVLVNNAGIAGAPGEGGLVHTSVDGYQEIIAVNQLGTFLGMQAVVESMRRAGQGSIVNVSSIAGLGVYSRSIAYTASKWAIRGMTKSAALELAPVIRVNSIHPGSVDTPMAHPDDVSEEDFANRYRSTVPLGRHSEPIEIAQVALFLASDDSSFMTGAEVAVDGGRTLGAVLPG